MEEKKKGFIKKFVNEFKAFALKGNVMDLAVGVIIGAAFQNIVTSFTENFINPIIGCIGGADVEGKIHLLGSQYINYGAFLTAVINFIIMAFVIFVIMKVINKLASLGKHEESEKPAEPPVDIVLLTEIRDLLKAQQAAEANKEEEKAKERLDLLKSMNSRPFWHYCEVCGAKVFCTAQDAFDAGWDYPPQLGRFGLLGPRTCGECDITSTLYWKVQQQAMPIVIESTLTKEELKTWRRIKNEPESLL